MTNGYKMVQLVIVEKGGDLVETKMKEFSFDSLYKKCKFRKDDGFSQRALWKVKISGEPVHVVLWARDFGKAGMENKYDLPPPVDQTLFFGGMALVRVETENADTAVDFTIELWHKVYEKLFGGFHNLADTAQEDEEEEDELADLPSDMKTKHGYLKDDFIVDDHTSSVEHSVNGSVTPTLSGTDDDYESELDFEEYEYMDSSGGEEISQSEEEEEQDS